MSLGIFTFFLPKQNAKTMQQMYRANMFLNNTCCPEKSCFFIFNYNFRNYWLHFISFAQMEQE